MAIKFSHTIGAWAAAGRSTKRRQEDGPTIIADTVMTFTGFVADADTPGDLLLLDGTTQLVLPEGFRPMQTFLRGTSGASETIDVGLTGGNQDALVAEGAADGISMDASGQDLGVALTADTVVTFADGATPSTGGTLLVVIHGVMARGTADLFMK